MCTIIGKFSLNTLGGALSGKPFQSEGLEDDLPIPLTAIFVWFKSLTITGLPKILHGKGRGCHFFSKTNSGGLPTFFAVFCQQMLRVKELFNTTQQYFMNFFANQEKNSIKKDSKWCMSGTKNLRLFGGFFTGSSASVPVMGKLQKSYSDGHVSQKLGDSLGLKETTNLGDFLRRFRFLDLMVRTLIHSTTTFQRWRFWKKHTFSN